MTALYCEIDPYCVEWLRNLIAAGLIADGDVADCSIEDLRPADVARYTQFHPFAGIGLWSLSLRLAGWPDDRPVWTASPPCQPFSAAGKGGKFDDIRHLWPATFHLIEVCRPGVIFGEQVASSDGLEWLDLVQNDMEGARYTFGAIDTSSALHAGAHIRQRLRFVGLDDASGAGLEGYRRRYQAAIGQRETTVRSIATSSEFGGMADANGRQRDGFADGERCQRDGSPTGRFEGYRLPEPCRQSGGMANANDTSRTVQPENISALRSGNSGSQCDIVAGLAGTDARHIVRGNPDWLFCRDGKWRPVESGTFPLAYGLPAGMGTLRPRLRELAEMAGLDGPSLRDAKRYRKGTIKAYGNGIDVAATVGFIRAFMEHDQ